MNNLVTSQATKLAENLGISGSGSDLVQTLKATAFKGQVSDAQMAALLIVATQYGLSPWTKEIYAFPDKNNGIVPVVGVDGWSRIINSHPQFDGMDFEQDAESCTCRIYRKDRAHPIAVTEYLSECKRGTGPWQSHPRRMLRHKTMIQCARIAFGYGGIYDQDEAERIIEATANQPKDITPEKPTRPQITPYPEDKYKTNLPTWKALIGSGKKRAVDVIATIESKHTLTEKQKTEIKGFEPIESEATAQPDDWGNSYDAAQGAEQ